MDKKEIKETMKKYAEKNSIKLNPDNKIVDIVLNGLLKNKEKHREIYCPCRIITGNKEKDREIICPCVFHRGEIEIQGHCKCLLFVGK